MSHKALVKFAGHVLAATIIFVIIAVPAAVLWSLTHFLEARGVDPMIIWGLTFLERLIFCADVTLFGAWTVASAVKAFKAIVNGEEEWKE